jgi:ABC-type dipeptide/oligopeptide/nickel transport system permease subunit
MGRRRGLARLAGNPAAVAGAVIVGLLALFALVGPIVARHGVLESDFDRGLTQGGLPVGPSGDFPLGTDRLFRDEFARLAYAGRLSLLVSVAATALASGIGAVVGIVAGWCAGRSIRVPWAVVGGLVVMGAALALGRPRTAIASMGAGLAWAAVHRHPEAGVDVDGLLMRSVDVMLAFPFLLLVMAVGAAIDRLSVLTVFVTLGATSWPGIARVLRTKTMQVRALDYVVASQALGQSTPNILFKHVLPNVAGPLIVSATMQVPQMILAESTLSYLGAGISPPTPTWGRMIYEGQEYWAAAPWLIAAPGAALVIAVWGFNMFGEGLRDALDPRQA